MNTSIALGIVLGLVFALRATAATPATQPVPLMKSARIDKDFDLDGDLSKPVWQKAAPVRIERTLGEAAARSALSTPVRSLWSDQFVYFSYECPYTTLTTFEPPYPPGKKRIGLWDRDVVEAFIGADAANICHYTEYEIAPTNERIDLSLVLPDRDFAWDSHFESAVKIDPQRKLWTVEMRIPLASLSQARPTAGTRWRLNLYRSDRAAKVFLAWSPTLTDTAHTPERFGILEFGD